MIDLGNVNFNQLIHISLLFNTCKLNHPNTWNGDPRLASQSLSTLFGLAQDATNRPLVVKALEGVLQNLDENNVDGRALVESTLEQVRLLDNTAPSTGFPTPRVQL